MSSFGSLTKTSALSPVPSPSVSVSSPGSSGKASELSPVPSPSVSVSSFGSLTKTSELSPVPSPSVSVSSFGLFGKASCQAGTLSPSASSVSKAPISTRPSLTREKPAPLWSLLSPVAPGSPAFIAGLAAIRGCTGVLPPKSIRDVCTRISEEKMFSLSVSGVAATDPTRLW